MTINDLRKQFEKEYERKIFYLDRLKSLEYKDPLTFQAWNAYKLCASLNGILPKDFDIYSKEAN